jgi:hypothetical protein
MIFHIKESYNFGEGLLSSIFLFGLLIAFFGVYGILLFVGIIMVLTSLGELLFF